MSLSKYSLAQICNVAGIMPSAAATALAFSNGDGIMTLVGVGLTAYHALFTSYNSKRIKIEKDPEEYMAKMQEKDPQKSHEEIKQGLDGYITWHDNYDKKDSKGSLAFIAAGALTGIAAAAGSSYIPPEYNDLNQLASYALWFSPSVMFIGLAKLFRCPSENEKQSSDL